MKLKELWESFVWNVLLTEEERMDNPYYLRNKVLGIEIDG